MSSNKNKNNGGSSISRVGTGRKKIPIEKIENKSHLQVSFSKRRLGLFKKANELSILCGAEIALLVFSPSGKVYAYAHPNLNKVLERYCSETGAPSTPPTPPTLQTNITEEIMRARQEANMQALAAQLDAMEAKILELTKANQALSQVESQRPSISDLPLSELQLMKRDMEMLRSQVHERLMINYSIMALQAQSGMLGPYSYFTANGDLGFSGAGPSSLDPNGMGPSVIGHSGVGSSNMGSNNVGLSILGPNGVGLGGVGPNLMGHNSVGQSVIGHSGLGQSVMGYNGVGPSIMGPSSVGHITVVPSVMGYNDVGLSIMGPSDLGQTIMGTSGVGPNGMGQNVVGLSGMGQNGVGLSGARLNGVGLSGVGSSMSSINSMGPSVVGSNVVGMNSVGPSGMGPSGLVPSGVRPSH